MVLSALADDAAIKIAVHRIEPALGAAVGGDRVRAVIADLAGKRGHKFTLERAEFLTVLHRLFVNGSDRAADRWREDYAIAGIEGLDLRHFYRAMAWPGEELSEKHAFRLAASRTWWGSGWRVRARRCGHAVPSSAPRRGSCRTRGRGWPRRACGRFAPPSTAACNRAWLRAVELGVGAQHQEAAEPSLLLDLIGVDLSPLGSWRGDDRSAVGGILLGLMTAAADDVAPPRQHHRFGLLINLLAALLHYQRHERRRIGEHQLAHQFVRAFAHRRSSRRASSSAMVSALIMPRSATTHTRAMSNRDHGRPVHLRAHWSPVAVKQHGEDHLPQVRAVVLPVAVLAQRWPPTPSK
jgi:hypothetical protein